MEARNGLHKKDIMPRKTLKPDMKLHCLCCGKKRLLDLIIQTKKDDGSVQNYMVNFRKLKKTLADPITPIKVLMEGEIAAYCPICRTATAYRVKSNRTLQLA